MKYPFAVCLCALVVPERRIRIQPGLKPCPSRVANELARRGEVHTCTVVHSGHGIIVDRLSIGAPQTAVIARTVILNRTRHVIARHVVRTTRTAARKDVYSYRNVVNVIQRQSHTISFCKKIESAKLFAVIGEFPNPDAIDENVRQVGVSINQVFDFNPIPIVIGRRYFGATDRWVYSERDVSVRSQVAFKGPSNSRNHVFLNIIVSRRTSRHQHFDRDI